MPTPVITVVSADIVNGGVIPAIHKGVSCGQPNINPQLSWTVVSLPTASIASFSIYIVDNDTIGTGPGNKFLHWGVEGIAPTQLSVGRNALWFGSETILPTDYGSGDAASGYNGPCTPSLTSHIYHIIIEARLTSASAGYYGTQVITSNFFHFTDVSDNTVDDPGTGTCGSLFCPPGTTLIGTQCQLITNTIVGISKTLFKVINGDTDAAYGEWGTRLYQDITTGYSFPLLGDQVDPTLQTSGKFFDSLSVPVALDPGGDLINGLPWISSGAGDGRLNTIGVWTDGTVNSDNFPCGVGNDPCNEWIGFSACVTAPATQQYCIGFGADNMMRLKINGVEIARTQDNVHANYKYWHILPIILNEGLNIIVLEGLNLTGAATFGAEIYDATPAELVAIDGLGDAALAPFTIWSTISMTSGTNLFQTGEDSGRQCPGGMSFNNCDAPFRNCSAVTYTLPSIIECCYVIENCDDETDIVLIEFHDDEVEPLYINDVYLFANGLTPESQAVVVTGKCWILKDYIFCLEGAEVIDITISAHYTTEPLGCLECDPAIKIEQCIDGQTTGVFEWIKVPIGGEPNPDPNIIHPFLTAGNIYEFSLLDGCWKVIGTDPVEANYEVQIITDFNTTDCLACALIYQFKSCDLDGEGNPIIIEVVISGSAFPTVIGNIYELTGDPVTEYSDCWIYLGTVTSEDETYPSVVISTDYECDNCTVCHSYYKLTNCKDPTDIRYILWNKDTTPLDESQVYIFDFASDICFIVELQFTPCIPEEELLYTACAYNFMEGLGWVEFGGSQAGNSFEYRILSVIINGIEYVASQVQQSYTLSYTVDGLAGLNTVSANNACFGITYTDQVDGFNSIFVALGVDHLLKAQVVRDDSPLFDHPVNQCSGGMYILKREDVNTFSIIHDGTPSFSWRKILTESSHCIDEVLHSEICNTNPGYDYFTCVDAEGESFVVIDGVVQEPNAPG
jgi:phosphatidylethanolamine-binding protein (PEBP) family uncharacterized protein